MFCAVAQDTNEKTGGVELWKNLLHGEAIRRKENRVRGYLAAVWRAVRRLAVLAAFCQMLFDFIKEVYNAVQNQHRAGMCGNRLFY